MLAARAPPIPSITPEPPLGLHSDGNLSDTGSGYFSGAESASTRKVRTGALKFPHLRGQLVAIAREYKPLQTNRDSSGAESDEFDNDADADADGAVSAALVRQVAALLDEENEDELKALLKGHFEIHGDALDAPVLELMHAHKDDTAGVPFLFLTPTRRPISRPSSRASSHSFRLAPGPPNRPETPQTAVSAPSSPSLLGPIRRPHTPAMSPLGSGAGFSSQSFASAISPTSSPVLSHTLSNTYFATSLPASPLSSPRLLNAKASEFRPTRPHSSASMNTPSLGGRRTETPSPDLWAHGSGAIRGASKLAIASPLIPDGSLLPPGTPPRAHTPTSPLRVVSSPYVDDEGGNNEGEDEDPFDPFSQSKRRNKPRSFHAAGAVANPVDFEAGLSNSSNSNSSMSEDSGGWAGHSYPIAYGPYPETYYGEADAGLDPMAYSSISHQPAGGGYYLEATPPSGGSGEEVDPDTAAALTDGMTPFDVLSSVFGATLAPSELEEALAVNGYDFERAMQWLVDRASSHAHHTHSLPGGAPGRGIGAPRVYGAGVQVVPRSQAAVLRGGRGLQVGGRGAPRYVNGRPTPNGNRVCRYFLAGECMRADCRFSHDLDRALCRFWLRGACAKGDACEFLHHLPNEVDMTGLSVAMTHAEINDQSAQLANAALDEFPTLGHDSSYGRGRGFGGYSEQGRDRQLYDPGRSRFAAVVKKPVPSQQVAVAATSTFIGAPAGGLAAQMASRREAKAAVGDSVYTRPTVVAPRASPRIKLRSPTLMPTLPTGEAVNQLYMAYRSRALQLGAARNACLSRAADAWRRGDGAAAKRFSREGHDLNAKMGAEATEAAGKLVRERAKLAEAAVRARDAAWSDDAGDRTTRGKAVGGGLGVCLGVASKEIGVEVGGAKLTQEERTEAVLDLHGLHANEATEVLEEFLLALEREHFFGLAYIVVGEEKHTGTQDAARGASRARLATGIREWLHNWGYPWQEREGIICVDALTHLS